MNNFTFSSTHHLKVTSAYKKPELTTEHLMGEIVGAREKHRNNALPAQQIRFCYGRIMKIQWKWK
jgi:hypothetical protein